MSASHVVTNENVANEIKGHIQTLYDNPAQILKEQKWVIDQLINGKIPYDKSTLDLLKEFRQKEISTAVNALIGVSSYAAKTYLLTPGKYLFSFAAGLSYAALAPLGVVGAIGVGITLNDLYKKEQKMLREISNEAYDSIQNLYMYIQNDEGYARRISDGLEDPMYFIVNIPKSRDHPAILSWRLKRQFDILGFETKEESQNYQKYQKNIEKYIKPEKLKDFEADMQVFCAANKILADKGYIDPEEKKQKMGGWYRIASYKYAGEFKNSPDESLWNPLVNYQSWKNYFFGGENQGSINLYQAEMESMLKPEYKNAFNDIKKSYYGATRALIFAQQMRIEEIDGVEPVSYVYRQFNEIVKNVLIDINTKTLFLKAFEKYRYYAGECEFNANDFFKLKFFDKHQSKFITAVEGQEFHKKLQKVGGIMLKETAKTAALGACYGAAYHFFIAPMDRYKLLLKEEEKFYKSVVDSVDKGAPDYMKQLAAKLKDYHEDLALRHLYPDGMSYSPEYQKLTKFFAENPYEKVTFEPTIKDPVKRFLIDAQRLMLMEDYSECPHRYQDLHLTSSYIKVITKLDLGQVANHTEGIYKILTETPLNQINLPDINRAFSFETAEYVGKAMKEIGIPSAAFQLEELAKCSFKLMTS